jgi:hypothetical protein
VGKVADGRILTYFRPLIKLAQASAVNASVRPSRSVVSRTATVPALLAVSTHAPEPLL